jgi:HEAT repeat protein
MLVDRLRSPDTSMFRAGLWVLQRDLPGAAVTRAAVGILPTLPAERRALVVAALGPRGDASATEAIAAQAVAGNKDVRIAAVRALVALKNRSAIATLVRLIADPNDEVARAAQDGLASLSDADVAASAQSLLSAQDPRARVAEVTLVARRRLAGFSAKLLAAARDADPDVRAAAMKALATQSGPEALPGLLDMLASGIASQEAAGVEAAVAAVCSRMPAAEATSSVRARLAGAGPAARCALIRVLGGVGSGDALQAVLSALHDDGEAVRRVAAESVQGWPTADAVPDLLRLARSAPDTAHRLPFLRGLLRIAAGAEMPSDARLTICREAIPMVERDEEKRTLLAALSATGLLDAVPLIEPHLDHAPVRAEACAAVLAIAERISGRPWPGAVAAALEKVSRMSADPDTVRRARALL